jgi:hypothetical protein
MLLLRKGTNAVDWLICHGTGTQIFHIFGFAIHRTCDGLHFPGHVYQTAQRRVWRFGSRLVARRAAIHAPSILTAVSPETDDVSRADLSYMYIVVHPGTQRTGMVRGEKADTANRLCAIHHTARLSTNRSDTNREFLEAVHSHVMVRPIKCNQPRRSTVFDAKAYRDP